MRFWINRTITFSPPFDLGAEKMDNFEYTLDC